MLTAILIASISALAEEPETASVPDVPAMSLDEALVYARAHEPRIRSALAQYAARNAETRIPRAGWLPQIGATAQIFASSNNNSSATYINVPEVDIARTGGTAGRTVGNTIWRPAPTTLVAMSINQEVYDFGRIAAQSAIADARAMLAHADTIVASLDVQLAVEEAFHGVLAAKSILSATEEAYKRAETHRDFALIGTKSGLLPPIDLTRAQADVALLGVRLISARSGIDVARAALAASMGSDALQVDAWPLNPDESASPALDEVLRTAGRQNPFILAAIARLDAQRATTRAISRELLPNLFATGGISGRAGGTTAASKGIPYGAGWLPDVGNWDLGAVLSWKLFDGTVRARRNASLAREQASQAELDLVRMSTTLASQRAYLNLDAALKALPGLRESVSAAQANETQADARFKAGLGNVVELADAETLLTNAQLDLAIGEFTVARTRAQLGRAMGETLVSNHPSSGKRP